MSDSEHEETASYISDGSDDEYFSDEDVDIETIDQEGGYPTFGGDSDSEDGDGIIKPKIKIGAEINDSVLDDEMDFGGEDDEDEDEDEDEIEEDDSSDDESPEKESSPIANQVMAEESMDTDEDTSDEEGDDYLKKFDREVISNYVDIHHPESRMHNYDEVRTMSAVVRGTDGAIIDDLHKTLPFMTKFEKARILGIRAKQINEGAQPFVKVPPTIVTGYTIAQMELENKKIPFIIRRPIPGGGSEYWKASDLELII
jgi:DNA-directed RNA polymerase I, II, and III subunit RPABC2